jgi:Tol biopolymer transport system component
MSDMTAFEANLTARLLRHVAQAPRPFDAREIARASMTSRTLANRLANRMPRPMFAVPRRWQLGLVLAVMAALAAGLMAVAGTLTPHRRPVASLAYMNGGALVVAAADGTSARTIATFADTVGRISWAPTGDRLFVNAYHETGTSLEAFTAEGRHTGSWGYPPASGDTTWSPDGLRLAVLAGRPQPRAVAADETLSTYASDFAAPVPTVIAAGFSVVRNVNNVAWSPDGRSIAITECVDCPTTARLLLVDVANGNSRVITTGEGFDHNPVWSHNGDLWFARGDDIWRLAMGQSTPAFGVAFGSRVLQIRPSPDGSRIAVLSGDQTTVAIIDVAAGQLEIRTDYSDVGDVRWTPDGQGLLLTPVRDTQTGRRDLVELDLATGVSRVIAMDVETFDLSQP